VRENTRSSRWCRCCSSERVVGQLLARGVVGADQQVADDDTQIVAQRRHRHHGREAAAVLADAGQFVDVLDAARGLEDQRLEAGRDRRWSSSLRALARAITSCGSEMSAGVILFITSAAA
jgi:hypothetical protein